MEERVYLASPHMGDKETEYIRRAFQTNWIAPLGPNVDAFEEELAEKVGIKSALALSSGTSAIHLAIKALGVESGDIVFCSALTFAASCNPIIYEDAIPVFIDSEPESWNMSPRALEKAFEIYPNPKAVIVVNLYGQSADMDEILRICNAHDVPVIEDAAESLGATYKGRMSGTIGKMGIYSFNGNKIITTSGGGMLVSDDEQLVQKARFWSTQAKEPVMYYEHKEIGYNYRLSNILAGVGRGQLQVLNERIEKKKAIYEHYKQAFADIEAIEMMPICTYGQPNYWLSTLTIHPDDKVKPLDIIKMLQEANIESRMIWKPMQLQPFYKTYEFFSHDEVGLSVSEDIFNRGICLPSDTKMTIETQDKVIKMIKKLFED